MVKFLRALAIVGALFAVFGSVTPDNSDNGNDNKGNSGGNGGKLGFQGTPPLVIKGYRFFSSTTGEYVGARCVNYYPRPNAGELDRNNLDFFTSKFAWQFKERDIPQFEKLNANMIRLYAVDPDADHRAFMCELQAKGIYVIVDLGSSCPGCEITPDSAPTCYPKSYKNRGERIIREFARYDNVMAFSGGNEVNHRSAKKGMESNAPCQKMFVRDMRNFIAAHKDKGMRQVPVGLVTADADRDLNALYYNCQSSELSYERAEWYGINTYIQCDDISDPKKATGFNNLRDSFKSYNYSIPVVLTEFGCTSDRFPTQNGRKAQRTFHDAVWMNSPDYSDYFAGGCAFEYSTENANSKSTAVYPFTEYGPQNYGLGYFSPVDCDDTSEKTRCKYVPMENFNNLAAAYKKFNPSDEPSFSKFEPASNRLAPTKCPAEYPSIGAFKWDGGVDPLNSFDASQVGRYQCPTAREALDALLLTEDAGVVTSSAVPVKMNQGAATANYSQNGNLTTSGNGTQNSTNSTSSRRPTHLPSTATPKPTMAAASSSDVSSALDSDPGSGSKNGTVVGVRSSRAGAPMSSPGVLAATLAVVFALLQHF